MVKKIIDKMAVICLNTKTFDFRRRSLIQVYIWDFKENIYLLNLILNSKITMSQEYSLFSIQNGMSLWLKEHFEIMKL